MIILCQSTCKLSVLLFANVLNLIAYSRAKSLKDEDDLKFSKGLIQSNINFSVVLPLLTSTPFLCVLSDDEEFLTIFTKTLKQSKILIYSDTLQKDLKLCVTIIVFDFDCSLNCSDILINLSTPAIYILNSILKENISDMQNCFGFVSSPEVVVISLLDDSVYELSPAFSRPRYFTRSSVPEVLKHRIQPKKLNLGGSPLTVATMHYFPFFIIKDKKTDKQQVISKLYNTSYYVGEFDGIEEKLINEISRLLNVTPNYLIYNTWGTLMPNGTWVGQINEAVQEGRADIAMANLWQIPSLYTAMDFGPSMAKIKMGFLARRPEKIDFHWLTVLRIFKVWVWLATLLSFVLVVIAYWAGVNWDLHSHSESWAGSIMTMLGHLTMSTSHRRVRDGNTLYTLTSWSLFSLLFTTALSSGIVTRLTLPQYTARLDTIKQLVEGHHYWTVEYYRRFRQNQKMREFMFDLKDPWDASFEDTYIYLETDDILRRAETDSKITFPGEKYSEDVMVVNTAGLLQNKAFRKFRFCKESASETHVSIGIKKNSPLFEPLSYLNLKFLEVGLVEHWKNEVSRRWPQYDSSHLTVELDIPTFGEPQPLLLNKVRPVFFLLLFGLAIASLVFVVEIIW